MSSRRMACVCIGAAAIAANSNVLPPTRWFVFPHLLPGKPPASPSFCAASTVVSSLWLSSNSRATRPNVPCGIERHRALLLPYKCLRSAYCIPEKIYHSKFLGREEIVS
jgi:hypothetical protein